MQTELVNPPRKAQPPSFSAQEFRSALGMFATGVTIVTARTTDGSVIGLTANSFNSVSLDPPLVLWSLAQVAASMPAFRAGSHYAINVLAADQKLLAERFALKGADRWNGVQLHRGRGRCAAAGGRGRHLRVLQPQPLRRRRPCDFRRRGRALQLASGRIAVAVPRRAFLYRASLQAMREPRFVDEYLGYLLGQANHALYKDFDVHVRAAGLTSIEWRVLATLHDGEPLTISQLAHEVLSKQPTVTKLVQRMSEQGWVVLKADPHDQRRTMVAATTAGKRLVRPLVEKAREHEAAMLMTLIPSEKAALKKLLAKLARALTALAGCTLT